MSRLLVSKKGKASTGAMTAGLALIAIGFWQLSSGMGEKADTDFQRFIAIAAPMLFLIAGAMIFAGAFKTGKTFINVYDDHIEGCGSLEKMGNRVQTFYFNDKSQYTVTLEGANVCINSNNGTFYICLTQPEANEVCSMLTRYSGDGGGSSRSAGTSSYAGTAGRTSTTSSTGASRPSNATTRPIGGSSRPASTTSRPTSTTSRPASTESRPTGTVTFAGVTRSKGTTTSSAGETRPTGASATSSQPSAAGAENKVICQCTSCSAKCRVPAGKGKIMVKCPKCGQTFVVTT